MNRYRRLQVLLKPLKAQGLTNIRLNACEPVLREEYERLYSLGLLSCDEDFPVSSPAKCASSKGTAAMRMESPATEDLPSPDLPDAIEPDPEIEALVAESWTDKPERAISTAAVYSVAGFAMVVLWIALIATTLAIAGLKCWYWCRSQYSDLALQLTYFDPSFEFPAFAKPPLTSLIPVPPLHMH